MINISNEQIKEKYLSSIHNKTTIRECRQFINDLFVSNSGENMIFVERTQLILEPKSNQFELEVHFLAEESFSHKYENLVKAINQKIAEGNWANHELMRYFKPESVIQVGQKLDSISDLEKLNTIGKSHKCNIEEGKIFLIYIWTIYKPICKKQLAWLNDIFIKHNWENNAKFITINTDHNREYAQKLIKLLHIDHMENLYIDETKFPNHPLFNVANKYGYPASILVNNDNIIDLCGSLFEINLEEKIETLLKRESTTQVGFYPNLYFDKVEQKQLKELKSGLQKKLKDSIHDVNANHLYGAKLRIKKIFSSKKGVDFIKKTDVSYKTICDLEYFCHTTDSLILDNIFEGIENINKITVNKSSVETYEIPFERNPKCSKCHRDCSEVFTCQNQVSQKISVINNSEIQLQPKSQQVDIKQSYETTTKSFNDDNEEVDVEKEDNYFACFYCKQCNQTFCVECGNEITDITVTNLLHKHFLYYIHTNNRVYMKYILSYNVDTSHDMDFKYFFENAKTEKLVDIASHFQAKCDSCLAFPIRTIRWKCCNCVCKNICDRCKIRIEKKDPKFYDDILWNMHQVNCDPLQHVFMKILFDCFAY